MQTGGLDPTDPHDVVTVPWEGGAQIVGDTIGQLGLANPAHPTHPADGRAAGLERSQKCML